MDILSTLPKVKPARGTPFFQDADNRLVAAQLKYLNGEYPDAKAALDDVANQVAGATAYRSRNSDELARAGLRPVPANLGSDHAAAHPNGLRLPDALHAHLSGVLDLADHQLVLALVPQHERRPTGRSIRR